MNQPTLQQLQCAFNNATLAAAFGEEHHQKKLNDLRQIRNEKHTWVGVEENQLRFEIDRTLREGLAK